MATSTQDRGGEGSSLQATSDDATHHFPDSMEEASIRTMAPRGATIFAARGFHLEGGKRGYTLTAVDNRRYYVLPSFTTEEEVAREFVAFLIDNDVSPCHMADIWQDRPIF